MIEFGKTLRAAREAKGYTTKELASMTRMLNTTIVELENEDFSRIPAPIYGRGFVKLYCEAVGLDPKPMIAEFMDILNGNRIVEIKERATAPVVSSAKAEANTPSVVEPAEAPVPEQPSFPAAEPTETPSSTVPVVPAEEEPPQTGHTAYQEDFFAPRPGSNDVPMTLQPPSQTTATPGLPQNEPPRQTISRYAAPIRQMKVPTLPPAFWRMTLVATAAIALLVLVFLGLRALHGTLSGSSPDTPDASPSIVESSPSANLPETGEKTVAPAKAAAPRTPQKIPSLYMD